MPGKELLEAASKAAVGSVVGAVVGRMLTPDEN